MRRRAVALAALLAGLASVAQAADPLDGRWSLDPSECANPASEAVLTVALPRIRRGAIACVLESVERLGTVLQGPAACTIEGRKGPGHIRLIRADAATLAAEFSGDATMRGGTETQLFQRCGAPARRR